MISSPPGGVLVWEAGVQAECPAELMARILTDQTWLGAELKMWEVWWLPRTTAGCPRGSSGWISNWMSEHPQVDCGGSAQETRTWLASGEATCKWDGACVGSAEEVNKKWKANMVWWLTCAAALSVGLSGGVHDVWVAIQNLDVDEVCISTLKAGQSLGVLEVVSGIRDKLSVSLPSRVLAAELNMVSVDTTSLSFTLPLDNQVIILS